MDRVVRSQYFHTHLSGLTPQQQHQQLVFQALQQQGDGLSQQAAAALNTTETDFDALRKHHRFLRGPEDDGPQQGANSWGARLARRYYARLFKEYAIADLSRYKECKIGLRWRTQAEVVCGKGQFTCGAKGCDSAAGLCAYEVNFAYQEAGQHKQALVKLCLCEGCANKLNYRRDKDKQYRKLGSSSVLEQQQQQREREQEGEQQPRQRDRARERERQGSHQHRDRTEQRAARGLGGAEQQPARQHHSGTGDSKGRDRDRGASKRDDRRGQDSSQLRGRSSGASRGRSPDKVQEQQREPLLHAEQRSQGGSSRGTEADGADGRRDSSGGYQRDVCMQQEQRVSQGDMQAAQQQLGPQGRGVSEEVGRVSKRPMASSDAHSLQQAVAEGVSSNSSKWAKVDGGAAAAVSVAAKPSAAVAAAAVVAAAAAAAADSAVCGPATTADRWQLEHGDACPADVTPASFLEAGGAGGGVMEMEPPACAADDRWELADGELNDDDIERWLDNLFTAVPAAGQS